jgi:hypothetical protein
MRRSTKRSLAVGAVVATAGIGATAWAAGRPVTGDSGTEAATSSFKPVHADVTVTGDIYPGRTADAVALVDNPNDFPVRLTGLTPGPVTAMRQTGGDNAACTATLTSASITATMPVPAPRLAAGAVDQRLTIPIAVTPELDVACAGSAISMSFAFTGAGAA